MWEGEEQNHFPTCGSIKRNESWAWTPSFGGRWIPWFKYADKWHEDQEPLLEITKWISWRWLWMHCPNPNLTRSDKQLADLEKQILEPKKRER
jgi:hypothetical protein